MYRTAIWAVGTLLGAMLLGLFFTLGYVANDDGSTGRAASIDDVLGDGEVDFSTLEQIVAILEEEYYGRERLDEQALYEAAVAGLLESLADTGTFYVDPVTFQTSIPPSGAFEGIGATVIEQNNTVIIVSLIANSPASESGIEPGDAIIAVDGESAFGWSADQAALRIRGPKGSDVTLSVRHQDGTTEDFTITRDEIQVESVTTTPPGGVLRDASGAEVTDIAYVRIAEFNERTPSEVEAVVSEAEESGKAGMILDLRVNPGGLLDETVDTADLFLDEGVILIEVDRDDNERFYRARPGGAALDIPIVILLDEYSASGAEVLAASLKDNNRAMIIGETSFGKGTVNTARELRDGGALFVTIRHWLTPKGVQIDGVGIQPDVEITPGPLDADYEPNNDRQLQAAIDQLRNSLASEEPAPAAP